MLARLASQGVGSDRIVPVSFHVDYFNEPWKDRFSDPSYSRREMAYNEVQKRTDLYFTPMLMIDGRYPMLGSDQPKAKAALARALKQRPGVSIDLAFDKQTPGAGKRSLSVTVAPQSTEPVGRELLVGVAITEDPVTTDVASGENEGKRLVEHYAVRKFAFQSVKLERGEEKTIPFPVEVEAGWVPANCTVAVFVQDWKNGWVYQAESVPWDPPARSTNKVADADRKSAR